HPGSTRRAPSKRLQRLGSIPPSLVNHFFDTHIPALHLLAQRPHPCDDLLVRQFRLSFRHRHKHRCRNAVSGDRYLLPFGYSVEERRQVSLRLESPDVFHKTSLNQSELDFSASI